MKNPSMVNNKNNKKEKTWDELKKSAQKKENYTNQNVNEIDEILEEYSNKEVKSKDIRNYFK
jgi:endonuclease III